MNSRILKLLYAVVIALLALALVVFMIVHIGKGVAGANEKLMLGAYILMIVWALMKLHTAIRGIRNTDREE